MGRELTEAQRGELWKAKTRWRKRGTLNEELDQLSTEAEKLRFMEEKREEFKRKVEAAGVKYEDVADLHYLYKQYCGHQAGFYPGIKKWRAKIERQAKSLGLDKIALSDGWVTYGAAGENPPRSVYLLGKYLKEAIDNFPTPEEAQKQKKEDEEPGADRNADEEVDKDEFWDYVCVSSSYGGVEGWPVIKKITPNTLKFYVNVCYGSDNPEELRRARSVQEDTMEAVKQLKEQAKKLGWTIEEHEQELDVSLAEDLKKLEKV